MSEHALQTEGAQITSMIERLAKDPSVDADKLERLFALQTKARNDEAAERYNAAILAVQSGVESVTKYIAGNHGVKYADLGAVMKMLKPLLDKHGVSVQFGTDVSSLPGHYGITCRVSHGRHSETFRLDVPSEPANAKMSAVHAMGSATTYGRRYLLCMAFNVPTYDDDGQAASRVANCVSDEQQANLQAVIDEIPGFDRPAFYKFMGGVNDISEIAERDYQRAMNALIAKRKQVSQ